MNTFDLAETFEMLQNLDESTSTELAEEIKEDNHLIDEVINDSAMKVFNALCDGTFNFDSSVDYARVEDADGPDTAILVGCNATMTLQADWDGTENDDTPDNSSEVNLQDGDSPIDALEDAIRHNVTFPIILSNGKKVVDFEIADGDYSMTDYSVDSSSHEDDGIGSYEYWGMVGYDSKPYVRYVGKITYDITCSIFLSIE